MLSLIAGSSIAAITYVTTYTVSFFTKRETSKENDGNIPRPRGPICRLDIPLEELTYETLNNKTAKNYLGDLVKCEDQGENILSNNLNKLK